LELEKEKTDKLITDAAKTIFSYCRARTNSKEDAEDLSQDILFELLRSKGSFCNDKAFYGFMWAVAGNVYKDWCKKRKKIIESELDENISDDSVPLAELLEKESDLRLLYRELSLLTEQYRKVIVQYYFNELKVSDISKSLNISESMVKFLLFKSRKILKEGMNMERTKGDLSFKPRHLILALLGAGANCDMEKVHSIWNAVDANLLAQNILFACYNDRCTAEEISLEIGVAVPYLEKDLGRLCRRDLLIQKGGKYETNIVIMTKEFSEEANEKILPVCREIADKITTFLNERLNDIKAIGFHIGVENDNLLKWQITNMCLQNTPEPDNPTPAKPESQKKTHAGLDILAYGIEHHQNLSILTNMNFTNVHGDKIKVVDGFVNDSKDFPYFDGHQNRVNILLDIAKGKSDGFSENDMFEIAEFIKHGYVRKNGDVLSLNIPIFTAEQFKKIRSIIDNAADRNIIMRKVGEAVNITTDILVQHTPVSLKKDAENMGWVKMREFGIGAAKIMLDNGILQKVADNTHPTTYIVLA